MKQALSVILRNSAPPAGGDPLGNDEGDFVAAIVNRHGLIPGNLKVSATEKLALRLSCSGELQFAITVLFFD